MGIIFSLIKSIFDYITRDERIKICFLGPAGSGKTTLMYFYSCRDKVLTLPTNGYNSDIYKFKKKEFLFWDVGAPQVKHWPIFIEAADFLFFVIDSSDINSIDSGRELLYQIYFGKRFRIFLENFKEKELEKKNNNYFFQEEEEEKESLNGEDYINLIEDASDYDFKNFKNDSDATESDKTSVFDDEKSSNINIADRETLSNNSKKNIPKVVTNMLNKKNKNEYEKNSEGEWEIESQEVYQNINNSKKNKKKGKKKKKVQVLIEMTNKNDEMNNITNIVSPLKKSNENSRKVSNESKKNINDYKNIPNEIINHTKNFDKILKEKPLLIIAHKQDMPKAFSTEELAKELGLYNFKHIKWFIRGTSSISGEGVNECLDWVIDNMNFKNMDINNLSSSKKVK